MDARLQRRIQRYGWDLAADHYDRLWRSQLAPVHAALLAAAALQPGERVLDVACGTGRVSGDAAHAVGDAGEVLGVDVSDRMVGAAALLHAPHAASRRLAFARMDAEMLSLTSASFDVALCALGLMYMPDPARALAEMRRVVRPGGRLALLVWGRRSHCAWAPAFDIVEREVASEVCPLFFQLESPCAWALLASRAGLELGALRRVALELSYRDADDASDAVLVGGPVALAWSRFDAATRERVRRRYLDAIARYRHADGGYRIPVEFVIVSATPATR